jgi:hypothetical protein
VRFAPGAAAAFIATRADQLTDAEGELDALTKASAFGLAERVAAAANPWGYIAASGFDVVRVVTPELHEELAFLRTRPYDIDLSPVENWPFTEVASAMRLTRTTNPRVRCGRARSNHRQWKVWTSERWA